MKTRPQRPSNVVADRSYLTVATYTLDSSYITPILLTDNTSRRFLPVGTVVAYNPTTGKVVPNYTTYGFGVLGCITNDADCGEVGSQETGDRVVGVVIRGIVWEDRSWDNGVYGTVLQATKDVLSRITFTKTTNKNTYRSGGDWVDWNVK
jgi:hypothetical protein